MARTTGGRKDLSRIMQERAIRSFLPQLIETDPFARYGIHGLGIGPKETGGKLGSETSLRFYVDCKLPASRVSPERRIPQRMRIPVDGGEEIEVATDVVETGPPVVAADPEDVLRPVMGGASCDVPAGGRSGTLGGWVLDRTDDTVVFLSNRHALGGVIGDAVIQPAENDGGSLAEHRIGQVKRTIPIKAVEGRLDAKDCNLVDAAIGQADDPDLIDLTVLEVGPAIYEIGTAVKGDRVQKTGQTTGYTTGRITEADYAGTLPNVPIGPGQFVRAAFCDVYVIEPDDDVPLPGFTDTGDSGAVLFGFSSETDAIIHPAVGLVYGYLDSPDGRKRGLACKIQNVFAALDLDVLCASGFSAYLEEIVTGNAPAPDRGAATGFTTAERRRRSGTRRAAGLARDVEKRISAAAPGRSVAELLRTHRHEIFSRLIVRSDLRRAATAALEPVLRRAATTDDVLAYRFAEEDVDRIGRVLAVLRREGLGEVADKLNALAIGKPDAAGRRVAELLELDEPVSR